MFFTFIVNPQAGGGFHRRRLRRFSAALAESGLNYAVRTTDFPKHAIELASDAASGSDVVVAVGGDGTVNEVVSGIVQSGAATHLAVIPIGTGNDFAKMLEIPQAPGDALSALGRSSPTRVDYGRVQWVGKSDSHAGIFVNAAGTGIDARVAAAAARIRLLSGTPRYMAAVLRTLRQWTAPRVTVTLEQGGIKEAPSSSEHLLVLAGNGRCAAGGFYLTPNARIDDGLLDACIIRNASIPRILALIPAILRGGRHGDEPEVTLVKADRILVQSTTPLAIQADGEVLTSDAYEVTFEVATRGLSVIQPVKR